jgi:DivIVA domain-containing protein
MALTPEDVQNKRFKPVRFKEGYDEEEVDAFLDEVEAELRRLLTENATLRGGGELPASPAPDAEESAEPATADDDQLPTSSRAAGRAEEASDGAPSETALRTLLMAQRTADDAIAQAQSEADQIVQSARTRAASMESEAHQQHAGAMATLQRQRSVLEAAIEELRGFEREYRTRLKAYLEGQLRELGTMSPAPAQRPAAGGSPFSAAPGPGSGAGRGASPPGAAGAPPPSTRPGQSVPGVASPESARHSAGTATAAPGAAGRFVEDVDAGSDTVSGPPREAGDGDLDTSKTPPGS